MVSHSCQYHIIKYNRVLTNSPFSITIPSMKTKDEKFTAKFHFGLTENLHLRAMEKAGIVPLATIIRELLRMWISDEVEVDYTKLSK